MKRVIGGVLAAAVSLAWSAVAPAQTIAGLARAKHWTERVPPFRIAGDVYYVGTRGLAAYLIGGPDGAVLLDGTIARNVPAIEASIRALGVPLDRVKLLLNSHAHYDHAAGLARLKRDTGAALLASARDTPGLEAGSTAGEHAPGTIGWFPPVKVDRTVRDGEVVRLGTVALTATLTPGHTPGCTTWSMTAVERGRPLRVVFPCSVTVSDNRLVGNRAYPAIVADYRRSFAMLATTRADIVLPAHPEVADVVGREARARAGAADAFVDPGQLGRIVADARADFDRELARQLAAARHGG